MSEEKKEIFFKAIGRRKEARAKVSLRPEGSGIIIVNGLDYCLYFPLLAQRHAVMAPLTSVNLVNSFDVEAKVVGGGKHGQAGSVRLGIARALLQFNPDLRPSLRTGGFLKRDPRAKERKKYGLRRARRAPQWQKR